MTKSTIQNDDIVVDLSITGEGDQEGQIKAKSNNISDITVHLATDLVKLIE